MVGTLHLKVLEAFSSLIKRLPITLSKRSDIPPQFCSVARREIFAEKGFGEVFPSSERVRLLILQLVVGSIP